MENSNIDETMPTPVNREPAGNPQNEETMSVPVGADQENKSNLGETEPVQGESGYSDDSNAAGFQNTLAVPVSMDSGMSNDTLSPGLTIQTSEEQNPRLKKKRGPELKLTLLGIVALILIAAISAFGGYQSGITLRTHAQSTEVALQAQQQFELGVQDMADEQYDRARQRFEYVINLNPTYPGAAEQLAAVLLELNTTATPTLVPTPTLTPTPDTRDVEEKFNQAQQSLINKDWSGTIDTLLNLRKHDANYRPVDLDGMLFLALRNRGQDKIGKQADLEGGIYDLTLAERFGPLDVEAQGYLNAASLYLTGASFWELDWGQAVNYFSQVASMAPGLRDGSGWTSGERYRIALINYGDQLVNDGNPCDAVQEYQDALSIGPDPNADQGLANATNLCAGGEGEPEPTPKKKKTQKPE
jgi:tetratricopeptide (TPR) repeat protein